jgi:hypothetical protein
MIDVTTFFKNASLFDLRVNDAVVELPSEINGDKVDSHIIKEITIHKYKNHDSDIEFYSQEGIIGAISLNLFNEEKYYITINGMKEIISTNIEIYSFLDILDRLGLRWEIAIAGTGTKTLCIKLSSNIYCFFDLEVQMLLKICRDKTMFGKNIL